MQYPRSLIAGIAVVVLAGLSAWQPAEADSAGQVIPLPAADRAQLETLLGKGVVGDALPSTPLESADIYLPAKPAAFSYKVVTKGAKTATETHQIEDTTDALFAPGRHYMIKNIGEWFLQTDGAGRVSIVAEIDQDNKVLSRFSPGEPLILPGTLPGGSVTSSLNVEVYDLSNLKKVSHTGSLDVTYTYVGTHRVTVPAGTYDAVLIRWDYRGKIGPATIKDFQYRFIAKGTGMVAMVQIRSISAMLFYNDHTKQGKLLM